MKAEELKEDVVKCLTPKEMKNLVRPNFEAHPEQFYPTDVFLNLGFSRAQCKCGHFYWRRSEAVTCCGDSNCKGQYTFIGTWMRTKVRDVGWVQRTRQRTRRRGGVMRDPQALRASPVTALRGNTLVMQVLISLCRYPVIARWRNDVQYVAAGIYCFQPYCVTGELQPPANPLICPQFCLRFNDLDNIGITGRHFSGFIMIGLQVFNTPEKYVFFKDECIEFNYRWLTEELKIDPSDITFVEDIWAGGGNLGPCVQFFVHGLQVGNMVFMQYKYDHEGRLTELPVKVIDVGIGLQRIPWLVNGSSTSYCEVFGTAFTFLQKRTGIDADSQLWRKMGPHTCKLDVDEGGDIEATWGQIARIVDMDVLALKEAILPVKEMYVVLDHTRTILVAIEDGGLPSNQGGGSNCRNILRRVFAILKKHHWWEKIGELDGLLELFQCHRQDLSRLYGKFREYKSFASIIKIEYERWSCTEEGQRKKLEQLIKNKKEIGLDHWIMAIQSWGIPADVISQICNQPIPNNLYFEIATRAEKVTKAAEQIFYQTITFPQTDNLYYKDHRLMHFQATVVGVLDNAKEKDKGSNVVLLDRSAFYPTSGGQIHDTGCLEINGVSYRVYNVEKVGKCFLHYLSSEVEREKVMKCTVRATIDEERRNTLRVFHTGTHVVYAAARRILGPHVWQNGAKKTQNNAHLDITHYQSISIEQELRIENEANKIILQAHPINKYFQCKSEAEKKHGFNLYQGGIVPGNTIRVVNIENVDVQACCGTHCDNTSEVGWVKIYKTTRISDGILRLYYVAGRKVIKSLNEETQVVNDLKTMWGITQGEIVETATRIFNSYKKLDKDMQGQKIKLLAMQVQYVVEAPHSSYVIVSSEKEPTLYFANLDTNLAPIVIGEKCVVFVSSQFVFGITLGDPLEQIREIFAEKEKFKVRKGISVKKVKKENMMQWCYTGQFVEKLVIEFFIQHKYIPLK